LEVGFKPPPRLFWEIKGQIGMRHCNTHDTALAKQQHVLLFDFFVSPTSMC